MCHICLASDFSAIWFISQWYSGSSSIVASSIEAKRFERNEVQLSVRQKRRFDWLIWATSSDKSQSDDDDNTMW